MKEKKKPGKAKKKKPHPAAFAIALALAALLCAAVLELSKNTLVGWGILVVLVAALILARLGLMRSGHWGKGLPLLCWAAFLALFALNLKLTSPPFRAVPAVETKSPAVTAVVSVAEGALTGVKTADGGVEVFAGIPYAAPPVGELRWREPQPAPRWEGVRACDAFAPMAMQNADSPFYKSLTQLLGTHDYVFSLKDNSRIPMSEDCLYLNVWRPADAGDEPLPVLFYIHGGSLMNGQSYAETIRGEDLARRGLIAVTVAYRLGVFGYYANEALAAESPNGTTGNYGLLDQIAALRWVHENIAAFGGDPEKVTVAGESAGSSSVNALCVSPLTEGLFRYAIGESSGIAAERPYHTFRDMGDALKMGMDILNEFKVSSVGELRAVPAEKLVQTRYSNSAMTVDGYAIAEQPSLTYARGANHEQALLNGFNAKEADAFLLTSKATSENYEKLLRPVAGDYAAQLAALVPPGAVTRDQKFIIDAGGDAKGSLCHVYSAAWFTYSHHVWSRYLLAQGRPVYEYCFTKSNSSMSNFHSGELPYAYGNLWRHARLYGEADFALSETMQAYWVNFVRTGDPNGAGLPFWEARSPESERLLQLDTQIGMIEDPYREIYPILDKYQAGLQKEEKNGGIAE